MNDSLRRFTSFSDFVRRFFDLFRGPTFLMTFLRVNGRLREKIILTVTVANNCDL